MESRQVPRCAGSVCNRYFFRDNAGASGMVNPRKDAMMPLFGRSKRPKEEPLSDYTVLQIMEYVDDAWLPIAASGWEGYDGQGPGFVFLDFEEDETKYVPASNPHVSNPRDPYWGDVRQKMKKYDPKTQVVVVFHQFVPGNTTSMVLTTPKGMPAPREAYGIMLRELKSQGHL